MIFINYDPFAHQSLVSISKDNFAEWRNLSSDLNDLSEEIVELCYKYNDYNIKFFDPSAIIIGEFIDMVNFIESTKYSQNQINIERVS